MSGALVSKVVFGSPTPGLSGLCEITTMSASPADPYKFRTRILVDSTHPSSRLGVGKSNTGNTSNTSIYFIHCTEPFGSDLFRK